MMVTIENTNSASSQPTMIGRSDHLQPFAASSNASTTMLNRSKPNGLDIKLFLGKRNRTIGGGNLGKSTRGWGSLPNNVLHKISDQVVENAELPWTMEDAYSHNAGAEEIAEMIAKRRDLCKLRLVARGWKHGVESHAFWPKYTLILDPSKVHTSTVADLRSSRTTPSTPSYPSLFHRARSLTLEICLPCRLNHPNRLGLYPAVKNATTWSNYLGIIPTCLRHKFKYCSCCLREENSGFNPNDVEVLLQTRPGDLDDKGRYYSNPIVCYECRQETLAIHIKKELVDCARGGLTSGQPFSITDTIQAQEYLSFGQCNVIFAAKLAIKESWMFHHTVYPSLESTLIDLQRCENRIKCNYILERRLENQRMRMKRLGLLQVLFDEPLQNIADFVPRIIEDIEDQYSEWSEEDEVDFEEDEDIRLSDVRHFWIETGYEAACYRWVRDRIRSGFWVCPSDELDSIVNPERKLITPRRQNLAIAHLPLGILQSTLRPYDPLRLSHDLMTPNNKESFLPPQSILEHLDDLFKKLMFKLLIEPCKSKVMGYISSGYDTDRLQSTIPSTSEMLEYLGTEDAWGHLLPYRAPVSLPISTPVWGKRRVSPEIEAVPISDEEGGDGFIVEVEDGDEGEDGDSEELEEEEGMVESKESTVMFLESTSRDGDVMLDTTSTYTDDEQVVGIETSESISLDHDEQNEEDTGRPGGNRKRKSPPVPNSRATKRRSSDENHPSIVLVVNENKNENKVNNENNNENNDENEKMKMNNDNVHNGVNVNVDEKIPIRNKSEESLTSSDTQPQTPPLLELELRQRQLQSEIELQERQRERAKREPRIANVEIPFIPHPEVLLGPQSEELFKRVYGVVLEPFVCCTCGICRRR